MTVLRKDDVVDDYHGTLVADPYRWLEDPDDPDTAAWTTEQNQRTRAFLDAIPARERFRQRLTELWNFPRYSAPRREGGRYFVQKNDGLQDQAVLYTQDTLDADLVELLDPNALMADGTIALTNSAPSHDGALLAYALSSSGSDWQEIRVRDVVTRADLPDRIQWCKFTSIAWRHDGSGFFYTRLPEPGSVPPEDQNNYTRVYFHALGTAQADDVLVYERPDDKTLHFTARVSTDGRFLVVTASHGTDPRTRLYYRPVDATGPLMPLVDEEDARYEFIDSTGETFHVLTNLDNPRGRIVRINLARPERSAWEHVLDAGGEVLEAAHLLHDRYVLLTTRDAAHRVTLVTLDGATRQDVLLPGPGTVEALELDREEHALLLSYTSFLQPSTPYRYALAEGQLVALHPPALAFDVEAYETRQVFCTSRDGTRVPLFVVHRRGLELDGSHPTLLYGYGGFNVSLTPSFAVHRLAWLEAGGVFALANLRGGDEYGEEWHQAGMLERKQNVFDDFIAAAEWLIDNGYTQPRKLAINGGSNGGLLVAACMMQRPELYGAVVCEVPVIDMLRYHRFTVGHYWVPEYGNAETNPEHFRFLYAYSPLHNVRAGVDYPPLLITSADTDDRVVPAHAKKFAATLQERSTSPHPVLIRIETKAGHGFGKPTSKVIDERADVYGFLWGVLGNRDEG
jgi:prolyl oligopeptidase